MTNTELYDLLLIIMIVIVTVLIVLFTKPKKKRNISTASYQADASDIVRLTNYIDRYNHYVDDYNMIVSEFEIEKRKIQNSIIRFNDGAALLLLKQLIQEFENTSETTIQMLTTAKIDFSSKNINNIDAYLNIISEDIVSMQKFVKSVKEIPIEDYTKSFKESNKKCNNDTKTIKNEQNTSANTEYFSDCTTIQDLDRRYRNLTKAFHPDNEWGNKDLFLRMQKEYEAKKRTIEKGMTR